MVLGSIPAFLGASVSLLWLHGLLIELQVDGVSREYEGFIIVVFTETVFVG